MHYGMVIDLRDCIGCMTCSVACKSENNLPDGVWWNRVETDGALPGQQDCASGSYPSCSLTYTTVACQHCAKPACAEVCPTGATYRDEATGIVVQNWDACIGCQACVAACPYGVRSFNDGEPVYFLDHAAGSSEVPAHKANVVEKCTFCGHRVAEGQQPACVDACPGRCRIFGDLDDPDSAVSQLLAANQAERLLEDQGTEPSVYYIR